MKINQNIKKQIVYRSTHRGFKEMDLLLGKFVKKYIDHLNIKQLADLENLLALEDDVIYRWYFENIDIDSIPKNEVTIMLKNFKL